MSRGSLLLVAAVAITAFAPAVGNRYAMDDLRQVAQLAPPESFTDWISLPAQPWWPVEHENFVWRPLARTTIAAQRAWHGDSSAPFYVFNLALYAVVSGLLVALGRRLGLGGFAAAVTGVIFAAHPIHAEAVHQVVGRTELLAAAFLLLGLVLFLRDQSLRGTDRGFRLWPQGLCFAAALASKEHAIVYPALLALLMIDLPPLRGKPFAQRIRGLPASGWRLLGGLTVIAFAYLGAKGVVTGGLLESGRAVPHAENPLATLSLLERFPAVLGLFGYAVSRFVIPIGLSPDYSANSLPIGEGARWLWAWVGLATLVGLGAAATRSARNGGRAWTLIAAGLGVYALTSNGPFTIGVMTAERLWFWPSAAACLGVGFGVDLLGKRIGRGVMVGTTGALVVALLAGAWHYAPAWRSPYDLAHWTLTRFPDSWRSHVNLARHYSDTQQYDSGLRHARAATRIDASHHLSWQAVGLNAMFVGGASQEAEDAFRRALQADPGQVQVHRYLANVLEMRNDTAGAAQELEIYLAWPGARDREVLGPRLLRLQSTGPGISPP